MNNNIEELYFDFEGLIADKDTEFKGINDWFIFIYAIYCSGDRLEEISSV